MQDRMTPLQVLGSCLAVSSLSSLAALLQSKRPIRLRTAIGAVLYGGMCGLSIGLIWYNYFDGEKQNHFFLIGVSGLAGLGGSSILDFVVSAWGRGGVKISIQPDDEE